MMVRDLAGLRFTILYCTKPKLNALRLGLSKTFVFFLDTKIVNPLTEYNPQVYDQH